MLNLVKFSHRIPYLQTVLALLLLAEVILAGVLFVSFIPGSVLAGVGQNVTVTTLLQVGNVAPEITSVSINSGASSIDLIANSTRTITVTVLARDYNNDTDIRNISVEFFSLSNSFYGDSDDNNEHYTNLSCYINYTYGDPYEVNASCTTNVWYYAFNDTWRAVALANDSTNLFDRQNATTTINTLLSLGLPDSIDYGVVNATAVSSQQIVNVTNFGNIAVNLTLSGYGYAAGDGLAMNCTLGSNKNISVYFEKYNLTSSNTSVLTLAQFETLYANLTATTANLTFNLLSRTNDASNDAYNSTYWRIYVPTGVAGSCQGNIVFGAIYAPGA